MATGNLTSAKVHPQDPRSSGTYRIEVRRVLTRPDVAPSAPDALPSSFAPATPSPGRTNTW